jgi:hypothetical protein
MSGLPDGLLSNQNLNLGNFWSAFDWKMLIYFIAICNILEQPHNVARLNVARLNVAVLNILPIFTNILRTFGIIDYLL